jgi:chemotaxis protein MotB
MEGVTVDALESEREQAGRELAAAHASQAELARALEQFRAREIEARRRVEEFRAMLLRFRGLVDAGKLSVRIVDGRMVLTLPMDILFKSGSAKVSPDGKAALSEVGSVLRELGDPARRFQVEGHTDDVPIRNKSFSSNWELSTARALSVVTELLAAGVRPEQLSGAGYAEHQPRTANVDDAARALNRRIEIVILPDLRGLPGYDELTKLAH